MKKFKFRFFIDYEREEQWINNMAEQGWHLKKFWPFVFLFENGISDQYIYRNEMVLKRKKDYFDFLDTMNIEHVNSFGVWAYFRKRKEEGPFEIFSGKSEKIKYLSRINKLFILACLINAFAVLLNIAPIMLTHQVNQAFPWICLLNVFLISLLTIEIYRNHKHKKKLKLLTHIYED
ncbi:DUF2812 domain-containing protein [Lysinibacillus pakistanensis]|uniref:DUF2812 domain-containing protein n=1 Tax=Lysinibacillus pakistanensis TaxID=759811 RepID=A0ABX6D987_9BACI|nr:DUF2812 domain-containing protein [Lysinibacillus pakistanensis]